MKRLFTSFLRRNLAAARLAILNQLEYRINFAIDTLVQPILTAAIEVTLWMALLTGMGMESLGGFGREYYLAYALWANFVGRVTINWMFEFIMLDEIDTGKVNAILVRPISFFEFYLSQFLGYKAVVACVSFMIPVGVSLFLDVPFHIERLPAMMLMVFTYLIFTYTMSFCVACLAFRMNRAHALTGMKNMALWVLSGEIVPLDLFPGVLKNFMMSTPFAAGVFVPVGFITGRFGYAQYWNSFAGLLVGIAAMGVLAQFLWRSGVRSYTGTGA